MSSLSVRIVVPPCGETVPTTVSSYTFAKELCELPHMSYPANAPTYIPKDQFVKYLNNYIEHFDIQPKYHTIVESCTYDEGRKCWFSVACVAPSVVFRYTTVPYCCKW